MKNKQIFGIGLCFSALVLCGVTTIFSGRSIGDKLEKIGLSDGSYTVTLNSQAFATSNLTASYQTSVTQNLGVDKPVLNYFLAKKDSGNNLVLAPAGKIYNYSSSAEYKGRITNIKSLAVNYTGGVYLFKKA